MPAAAVPIASREGVFAIVDAALPQRPPAPVGVILVDPRQNRGWVRFREDFTSIAAPEDAEVLERLEEDARCRMSDCGAIEYLSSLEDSLSNALRIVERRSVAVDAFSRVLDRLFNEHVEPVTVRPFETHVPLYSLRAAAGNLGEEMPSEPEDWLRPPDGMHITRDLFAAHVVGRSMEPRIPDGSLNLFRFHPAGSRQGKILLIQRFGFVDETARYTVKRYTSRKVSSSEDEWRHEQIRLEPLNSEFSPWDVGPEDFSVVAEWLRVLE